MVQKEWDMQSLGDAFQKIIRISSDKGFSSYYQALRADYDTFLMQRLAINPSVMRTPIIRLPFEVTWLALSIRI